MGVGPEAVNRNAVILSPRLELLESVVETAGYGVVGVADTAVNGEHLLRHFEPEVVVVDNDLIGPSGWESIPGLRAASPTTLALLVVSEDWKPRDLGTSGAFAVVARSRLSELVTELGGVDLLLAGKAESSTGSNRRTGRDRRLHQDWSKVGWERREDERRLADGPSALV
ncbi:MAG: DNA-binding NarL/FixJ family response regulator [Candidatus Aldehydirespiratoraceae bacterium]|jgi:DNA-binding NarL/FixJ family response regulator